MTDLVTILDRKFLEFLEARIVSLCKGKVSVVFEDLQSRPITETTGVRVFPERDGANVCKCMIDCPRNLQARRLCLTSDVDGATMARTHKKGYLYRCHHGIGFPNFLFPITIWPDEVVGYLYVGQFVFKRLDEQEKARFVKRLNESGYVIENASNFVSGLWSDVEREAFWDYIIKQQGLEKNFPKEKFLRLISNQIENFGVTPEDFFDIIELIKGLASNLSTLGNSVYLLISLIEIERRLPPGLKAKYDSAFSELREAIASVATPKKDSRIDVQRTADIIAEKSLAVLRDCKVYEEDYIKELVKPYKLGIIEPSDEVKSWIVQFYARSIAFEAILYSKIRTKTGLLNLTDVGDELVTSFFHLLASCGQQLNDSRDLVRELFLRMSRERDLWYLLKSEFIPCLRIVFDHPSDLEAWLDDNGITGLRIADYPKETTSFSRTFDLIIEDLESHLEDLSRINKSIGKKLTKISQRESLDIGDLNDYLHTMNDLRRKLSKQFSDDKFGTRQSLNQKAYKVSLNSGGLTSTHIAALTEQQEWLARRNEEGPIGATLENELEKRIEKTRSLVAKYIGAESPSCIVFTHNTTSAIDLVLRAILRPGDEILTTDLEHNVVYYLGEYYQKHCDCNLVVAEISENLLRGKEWLPILMKRIGQRTRVVIISHIMYGTGYQLPMHVLKKIKKASDNLGTKMFVLVDGAHAVGNIRVNVQDLQCDFYAFDGHKWLLGPEGTGLLYGKQEYLIGDDQIGIHIPLSTAYMASPDYTPKKESGRNYELGTMDVGKFIGLAPTIESLSKLRFSETSRWRKTLIREFSETLKGSRWKIINFEDAIKTGMLCLQISKCEDPKTYEHIAVILEKMNIIVRWIEKPPCIRICLHHYNNETDVKIAAYHLNMLLEGVEKHIGNHERIKSKLKEMIQSFLVSGKPRNLDEFVGLNVFSIAGAGKTEAITDILKELRRKRIMSNAVTIRSNDILKLEHPEREFGKILDRVWKQRRKGPEVIFIDEADSLLEKKQKGILGIFNKEVDKIKKDKLARIVFITAENDPYAIFESAASRLKLIYFPLPDFATRLKFLKRAARGTDCSSKLLLTQISRLIKWYTMRNLKLQLWPGAVKAAKGEALRPEHFIQSALSISLTASDAVRQKYTSWIEDLKPKLLTGEIEID